MIRLPRFKYVAPRNISEAAASLAVFSEVDLDMRMVGTYSKEPLTARWILQHLIEETARHNGHLDILREMIDGSVG